MSINIDGDITAAARVFDSEKASLAWARGAETGFSRENGIVPILRAMSGNAAFFRGCAVCDRVIGRAAALLLAESGAAYVRGSVMSVPARDALDAAAIPYSFGELVPFIADRAGVGMCPVERASLDIKSGSAFDALKKFSG